LKIICFGDSLTEVGYGASYFPELVKLMPEHELINAGVGGDTAINLLRRVDADVLEREPDGVFLMVGGNDAISNSQPKTRSYYRQAKDIPEGIVTPEMFEQAYRDLLTKLQLAHVVVWIGLAPNEYSPAVVAAHADYNERARRIARSFNLPVLDLMAAFSSGEMTERPELGIEARRRQAASASRSTAYT
jgi:lysophospholipase L1-like esterase